MDGETIKIILPEKEKIIKTSKEDLEPSRYFGNYFVNCIYRKRLELAVEILDGETFQNIVDMGCGSGILTPTLRLYSKKVIGMDTHNKLPLVKKNIGGYFVRGDITNIPFKNLDCVLVVSVLEHLNDVDKALKELKRCLSSKGKVIFGIPSDNFFVRSWFQVKRSPALTSHKLGSFTILKKIKDYFTINNIKKLNIGPINLYTVIKCQR